MVWDEVNYKEIQKSNIKNQNQNINQKEQRK